VSRFVALLVLATSVFLLSSDSEPAAAQAPGPKEEPKKDAFGGRTKKGRKQLLKDFGGSEESEEAVMLGLAWLTQAQNQDGGWVYDAGRTQDTAPATGMAVLAFLGAGQSHKDGRYKQTVQAGLDWLVKNLDQNGHFKGAFDMYGQGIATLALCEAYGMTQDPALQEPAQRALDYIQKAQGRNGSWGYQAGTQGDTSIVGWQIQALHAGQLAGLKVDDKIIKNAVGFLNYVSTGQNKSIYGYGTPGGTPATSLTAIGLLCRYYVDGWRDTNAGFAEGTKGLMSKAPDPRHRKERLDLYYYYYATQVVRFHGGELWKTWNEGAKQRDGTRKGGMPDWLIEIQAHTPAQRGSWDPEPMWFGQHCGRLGTTCMCLLTLEVYYRYSPEEQQVGKKP
jgi:hypothetical protein